MTEDKSVGSGKENLAKPRKEWSDKETETGDETVVEAARRHHHLLVYLGEEQTAKTMNYIFGNNTLYPRSTRVGGASGGQGAGLGLKQKLGPKRGSSEELAPPHTSSPSTSSPASSSPSTSSSRWQQLLMFFSRRSAFTDCINAGQVNHTHHCVLWLRDEDQNGRLPTCVCVCVLNCPWSSFLFVVKIFDIVVMEMSPGIVHES